MKLMKKKKFLTADAVNPYFGTRTVENLQCE